MKALGPTLALLQYSVRLEGRAIMTYVFRLLLGGAILLALYSAAERSRWMAAPGHHFFTSVLWCDMIFITLAGIGVFCAAITEEKEEGTLGLLRMTALSPVSILLGKGGSRLLTALLLLAVQFPFTLLAITLGGVSIEQIIAAYACMLGYVFLLANLGLLASTIAPRTAAAGAWVMGTLMAWFFVPLAGQAIVNEMVRHQFSLLTSWRGDVMLTWLFGHMVAASPFTRIAEVMSTGFDQGPIGFQVISNVVAGLVLFALSWLVLRSSRLEPEPASAPRPLALPKAGRRRGKAAAWVGARALAWKEFHFGVGGKNGLLLKLAVYCPLVAGLAWLTAYNNVWRIDYKDLGNAIMGVFFFMFLLECALIAGNIFNNEIKAKTLTSLGMLPMSMSHIAWHKTWGALLALLPVLAIFTIGAALAPGTVIDFIDEVFDEMVFWYVSLCVFTTIVLTAASSLYLRWGALPCAAGAVLFANILAWIAFDGVLSVDEDATAAGLIVAHAIICLLAVRWIPKALSRLAAES